jgi:hypothetical protein
MSNVFGIVDFDSLCVGFSRQESRQISLALHGSGDLPGFGKGGKGGCVHFGAICSVQVAMMLFEINENAINETGLSRSL